MCVVACRLKWLGPASKIANGLLFFGMTTMIVMSSTQIRFDYAAGESLNIDPVAAWSTLPIMFGMAVYSIEGIGVVLPNETAMKEPSKFPKVLTGCVLGAGAAYLVCGIIPYLAFGRGDCSGIDGTLVNGTMQYLQCNGTSDNLLVGLCA
jgi:solute carrier family 36 (proton-coupled amino acid transporter)